LGRKQWQKCLHNPGLKNKFNYENPFVSMYKCIQEGTKTFEHVIMMTSTIPCIPPERAPCQHVTIPDNDDTFTILPLPDAFKSG
jgi:hypothetical protein